MKAVIHQPYYLPYPGHFHKISMADVFVIMDNTQYDKRFTNRNKIINPNGKTMQDWISVPIKKEDKFLANKHVRINNDIQWREEHWKKISHTYSNSEFFHIYNDFFKDGYQKEWEYLFELDIYFLKKILKCLNINVEIIRESELNVKDTSTERLIEICKSIGADTYISGIGGRNYINNDIFTKNKIELVFQQYKPAPYKQRFSQEFIPDLSIIDMLSNVGTESYKFVVEKSLQYHNN